MREHCDVAGVWEESSEGSIGLRLRAAADEHFGYVVGRAKREEDRGAVDGVRDLDAVRDVGEDGLGVGLDVVDDSLVTCDHEYTPIWKSECTMGTVAVSEDQFSASW